MPLTEILDDKFLAEWFENKKDCSLTSGSRRSYDRVCSPGNTISPGEVYLGYAPYIINGINAVASAVSSILSVKCVNAGTGMCAEFRNVDDLGEQIADIVRNSNTGPFRITNGEGMSDLNFFNYKNGAFSNVSLFLSCFFVRLVEHYFVTSSHKSGLKSIFITF